MGDGTLTAVGRRLAGRRASRKSVAFENGSPVLVVDGLIVERAGRSARSRFSARKAACWRCRTRCGSWRTSGCCPTGAICTGRARRRSAPPRHCSISISRATSPFSMWSGTRATTFRSPAASTTRLNELTRSFDDPGRFVTLPGLRMVGEYRARRRPQRLFRRREQRDPPLLARARLRPAGPRHRLHLGRRAVSPARRLRRGRQRACRRPLRRCADRA